MGAFNGSGTFVRTYDWSDDAANAIKIRSDRMDTEDDGFATGLSNTICRDGQSTTTARIPFAVGIGLSVGSVSAPSIAATGDTNTGWYWPAADTIALAVGGSKILQSDSTTALAVTGNLSVSGTSSFTGNATFSGQILLSWEDAALEIGLAGTSNTPFIDFHSSASSTDYDARLIASGGTASVGAGTLTATCATFAVGSALTVGTTATITGAATLSSTLSVAGASTLAALTATTGSFSSTLAATGNLSVNTNKFTVTAASGNTAVAGTLAVTGATTLTGDATLSADLTVAGNAGFGNTDPAALIDVGGTAIAGSALPSAVRVFARGTYTSGSTDTLYGALQVGVNGDRDYGAMFMSRRDASGNVHAVIGVRSEGTTNSAINIDAANAVSFAGAVSMTSTLAVTGASTFAAVSGTTGAFSGNTTVGGTFGVTGATTLTGAATLSSTLAVTGAATFSSTVTASGNINANGSVYQVSGTQVLGSRKTGWSNFASGTQTRDLSAITTGAATDDTCAQILYALITDLLSHGVIGA